MRVELQSKTRGGGIFGFKVPYFPATLGRDPGNDVVLADDAVSRTHAELLVNQENLFIRDLDSANGTFVDDKRITTAQISDGSLIRLGGSEFHVVIHWMEETRGRGPAGDLDLSTHTLSPADHQAGALPEDGDHEPSLSAGTVLGFFQQAGRILESAFEVDETLRGILDLTFKMIAAERAFVLLADEQTGMMVVRAQKLRNKDLDTELEARFSRTILESATRQGKAILTFNAQQDNRFGSAQSVIQQAIRGAICVPLRGREKILGAIYVDSSITSHKLTVDDLKLLSAVGVEMGIAVENARLYESMIAAERLAAVGQAIAGLTHCIKNILNGMEGGSFILQRGIDRSDEDGVRRGWDILKRNSGRLKDLMLDMLTYSRPREPACEEVDANSIPREVVELLEEKARNEGVDLHFRPDPDLHGVQLDPKAIYRALLNLVTNAVEACAPDGGTVVVETHAVPNEPRFEVVVQDSGCGIPEEDLPKLGSAFFSTKGARGTGLGLSVTYKIVAEHAGEVSVSSQVGQGTTVTMALPIQEVQEETIQSVDLRAEG